MSARRAVATLAFLAAGCASGPEVAKPSLSTVALKNADFAMDPDPERDCPPQWWCTVHADPSAFRFSVERDGRSGNRLLRVERVKNEPWALASQVIEARAVLGKRIRLSVDVDGSLLQGAGAGPILLVENTSGQILAHDQRLQTRSPGWRTVSTEVDVLAGASMVKVHLVMEGGGVARYDNVRLEVLGPASPKP
jgi:hypothetical protein